MSNEYSVTVGGSTIDSVIANFPEISACIAAGVMVRPMSVDVPAIDFQSHRERSADSASPSAGRKPGMKR